ncbi:organic cation transporter protein-like [Achroia grisella]|uniref:organic cation transporter protein-like n=1 Tax=Achroia grisella TaxID=688607 RepID=UPI0027D3326E|nr:organic cation transporter protein-like [Achroia grisella]
MGRSAVSDSGSSSSRLSVTKISRAPGDADDVLETALDQLGPFGFYQRYVMVLLCIPNLFAVMYSLNYVFVADQVPFRCTVPECEGPYSNFANETATALLPNVTCHRYEPLQPDKTTCDRDHFHSSSIINCEHFVYENQNTIFAEFDLACREWMRTMVGTVRNAALPFALILTGYMSDLRGRRTAFCVFSAFAAIMGIIKAFSINYYMYLTLEFLEAALGYGFNSAAYVMMVELARPSLRAAFICATGVAYGLGGVMFAFIARGIPYWRHLLWTIHTPALLLPVYRLLVDESPRWLHARGRTRDAANVIRKAARLNKVILDEEVIKALENDEVKKEVRESSAWMALVRSRVLMTRFALCCWCWIASTFVYYGLTINSVTLAGDKYVNFALNMAMEIVASLLIMMALERFGRKRSIFVAFLLCGVACVVPYFVSSSRLGFFFLGKLAITFAFNSVYVFTAELFPTHARSSALAACSLVGRVGSILAPQTPLLSTYVQALLYGVCALLAALSVLAVPETRRARLPQSVQAAEVLREGAPHADSTAPPPAPPLLARQTPLTAST